MISKKGFIEFASREVHSVVNTDGGYLVSRIWFVTGLRQPTSISDTFL